MSRTSVLIGVGLLGALVACGEPTPDHAVESAPVQIDSTLIAVVDSVTLEDGPAISGHLVAERTAQLRPQVAGAVLRVLVREGESVRAGQLLAVIDTTVLADQLGSARAALRSADQAVTTAERNSDRAERLLSEGAIAPRDAEAARDALAQAEAGRQEARARLAAAEQQLAHALVRAPFDGVVSQLPVSVGDIVSPAGATALAVVVDPRVLELDGTVPASNLGDIAVGTPVEFRLSAAPERRQRGQVVRINPAIDPATGQVRLYVRLPNDAGRLAVGMFAEGRVLIASRRAPAVPLDAIDPRATSPGVRRVRHDSVVMAPVTFGLRDDMAGWVEVVSGLTVGDTVLVGGARGTPIGARVSIVSTDG